jgi:anhydro-N-acetylmuramic acid kinase
VDNVKIIGLMSGTSMDGLDIAFCVFSKANNNWEYSIEYAETVRYPENVLRNLVSMHSFSTFDFLLADRSYGRFIGEAVKSFCEKNNVKPDYISSHGHTIFHQTDKKITYQTGHGPSIFAVTGMPVIYDFRVLDVALGGQGAPLVPIGDQLLFSEFDFCINLGGISNISFDKDGKRIAFDISPCNILLNELASRVGH